MKIRQEVTFKPMEIIIETREEYVAFCQIIDEAEGVSPGNRKFMEENADILAIKLSDYFANNT